jgi:hypothetical protein
MGVDCEMGIVNGWKNAPASVHLRIILVDLRDYQEHWRKEKRERKARYERVRSEV